MKPPIDNGTILITGASSGIGAELARQLGPRAGTLILTARRAKRLGAVREEIQQKNSAVEVYVEPCDLSDIDQTADFAKYITERYSPLDILINNAGFGDRAPYDFAKWEKVHTMIRLNTIAPALLTHHFLQPMMERNRGGILNIGSGAGLAFMPAAASYVGTKHFVHGFTEVLRLDLHQTDIVVTEVCPGPVKTEFDERAGIKAKSGGGLPPFLTISAKQCAREALDGFEKGKKLIFPGRIYKILMFLQSILPRSVQRWMMHTPSRRARDEAERAG